MDLKNYKLEEIVEELQKDDKMFNLTPYSPISKKEEEEFKKKLSEMIGIKEKSVLGIDIYQYSQYCLPEQNYIPILFKLMMQVTNNTIEKYDNILFQKYIKDGILELNFIDSGDGGFLVFDNPLLSLAYAIQFEMTLTKYNTYHIYRKLRTVIKEINLRYSITYDTIFQLDKNYYGAALINNARIMAKDKLNRCLIDSNANDWYLKYINGIEQLTQMTELNLKVVDAFNDYDLSKSNNKIPSTLSKQGKGGVQTFGIRMVNSQKIGKIKSKNQVLSIYNIQIQFLYAMLNEKGTESQNLTATLGNLNTSGIDVE